MPTCRSHPQSDLGVGQSGCRAQLDEGTLLTLVGRPFLRSTSVFLGRHAQGRGGYTYESNSAPSSLLFTTPSSLTPSPSVAASLILSSVAHRPDPSDLPSVSLPLGYPAQPIPRPKEGLGSSPSPPPTLPIPALIDQCPATPPTLFGLPHRLVTLVGTLVQIQWALLPRTEQVLSRYRLPLSGQIPSARPSQARNSTSCPPTSGERSCIPPREQTHVCRLLSFLTCSLWSTRDDILFRTSFSALNPAWATRSYN